MRINSIQAYYKPTFTNYSEKRINNGYTSYTTTCFFRNDMDWAGLMFLMNKKYKDVPKVNMICYGCSDGEETYSLALKILRTLGKNKDKYFPIIAKDIDYDSIFRAKRGSYNVSPSEISNLNANSGIDFYRYFSTEEDDFTNKTYLKVKDILKENIIFKKGDILKEINDIPSENTVLICRNFWPYLPYDEQFKLAKALGEKMKPSSLVILGEYDMCPANPISVIKLLIKNGFEPTGVDGIFQKASDYDAHIMKWNSYLKSV